ncbi:MAG: Jag N-terminal domain-containing protein [candidate division WOR-3 bacterium]|jgi:spoIIIJ-associated protein
MDKEKKYIDVEDETVEKAIEKGVELLKTTIDNVDVEIINEPQNGFLKFGKKKAVVRLHLLNGRIPEELLKKEEKVEEQKKEKININEILEKVSTEKNNGVSEEEIKEKNENLKENVNGSTKELSQIKIIEEKFKRLTELMGFSVEPEISCLNNKYRIIIKDTPDANLLIGKNGKTIDALQHLLNKMLIKEKFTRPVYLDIKGYVKQKRRNRFLKNGKK